MCIIYFYADALTSVISITAQVARLEGRILRPLRAAGWTLEAWAALTSGAWPSLLASVIHCLPAPGLSLAPEGVLRLYHAHRGLQIHSEPPTESFPPPPPSSSIVLGNHLSS